MEQGRAGGWYSGAAGDAMMLIATKAAYLCVFQHGVFGMGISSG
jgi:hypothetical protein